MVIAKETITLDPSQFAEAGRVELGLDKLGLSVKEADWGDAQIELFMVRQLRGEIPADRHPPNRTVTIKLIAQNEGATTLQEALYKLQAKMGLFQEEGGWVRRDLDKSKGWTDSVALYVHSASLTGVQGWLLAHSDIANEIVLTLTCGPYAYRVTEQSVGTFGPISGAKQLTWEVNEVQGTAPGIIRIRVTNEDETDWFSLISAIESRDYMPGENAELKYEAEALTLVGSSVSAAKEEATGGNAVKRVLSKNWSVILESERAVGKVMTHAGRRRILTRMLAEGGKVEQAHLRLEWRAQGSATWNINEEVLNANTGQWEISDLGQAILNKALQGEQYWEWRVSAKTTSTETQTLWLDLFFILPAEQYLRLNAAPQIGIPAVYKAEDEFNEAGEFLNALKDEVGNEWETSGGVTDFKVKSQGFASRSANTAPARQARLKLLTLTNAVIQLEFEWIESVFEGMSAGQVIQSRIEGRGGKVYFLFTVEKRSSGGAGYYYQANLSLHSEGGAIANAELNFSVFPFGKTYVMTLVLLGKQAFGYWKLKGEPLGLPTLSIVMGESGAGTVGFQDFGEPEAGHIERKYYSFKAWEPEDEAVCFAGKAVELRSDEILRQHPSHVNVWGRLVPEGFMPYAPPSRLEGRKARGILIPSRGALGIPADVGFHKFKAEVFYFPAFHFVGK